MPFFPRTSPASWPTCPAKCGTILVSDPNFMLADYEPGQVAHIPVGLPSRDRGSRSVVLKRTLRRRPEAFIRYVIAHELAHAHLRNRGRWPGDDPEFAAGPAAAWAWANS